MANGWTAERRKPQSAFADPVRPSALLHLNRRNLDVRAELVFQGREQVILRLVRLGMVSGLCREGLIGELLDGTQRVVGGHPRAQIDVGEHHWLVVGLSAHGVTAPRGGCSASYPIVPHQEEGRFTAFFSSLLLHR